MAGPLGQAPYGCPPHPSARDRRQPDVCPCHPGDPGTPGGSPTGLSGSAVRGGGGQGRGGGCNPQRHPPAPAFNLSGLSACQHPTLPCQLLAAKVNPLALWLLPVSPLPLLPALYAPVNQMGLRIVRRQRWTFITPRRSRMSKVHRV